MRPLQATFSPPIVFVTDTDRDMLGGLLVSQAGANASFLLRQEFKRLSRASGAEKPFVRLGFNVTYRDLRTKRESTVRLVLTPSPDGSRGEVSVMEALGAALLGLPEGAVFRWTDLDGRLRAVKALRVDPSRSHQAFTAKWPNDSLAT